MNTAIVRLFGEDVGILLQDNNGNAFFEFSESYLLGRREIFPSVLEVRPGNIKANPKLGPKESFQGLHGPFADSLPGKFGNELLAKHFKDKGFDPAKINAVQKLLYVGNTGMGALEYHPMDKDRITGEGLMPLEVRSLYEQAKRVISGNTNEKISEIIETASSAGGARPKALIGMNKARTSVLSGIRDLPRGFEHYILKFDTDRGKFKGFGAVEYSYSIMARKVGIDMTETGLIHDKDQKHFYTKRFDRVNGKKIHMLSLSALAENDFNDQRTYDYDTFFRLAGTFVAVRNAERIVDEVRNGVAEFSDIAAINKVPQKLHDEIAIEIESRMKSFKGSVAPLVKKDKKAKASSPKKK